MAQDSEGQLPRQTPPGSSVGSERERASTGWRRASDTVVNHRSWVTIGGLVGVIGLVVSALQIWQSLQTAPEGLEVGAAVLGSPESIQAEQVYRLANNESMGQIQYDAIPIDLTLKNNGGRRSKITDVIADVKHFEMLGDCTTSGAGEAGVKAEYQIKLPTEPLNEGLGEHKSPIQFEVGPGSVERMSITVGPAISSFYYYPYVVGADIKLVHDNGSVLDAGAFTFVANLKAVRANLDDSHDANCARKNLGILQPIYAFQSVKAVELDDLRTAYRAVVDAQSSQDHVLEESTSGPGVAPTRRPPTSETDRPLMPA